MSTFLKVWLYSLFVKLVVSALVPLSSDEAYYWIWSHHIQLSYLDHPPFVAWLFKAGHFLEPIMHAVRWPAVILGHLILLVWREIWKDKFSEEQSLQWLTLYFLIPMTGVGSLIVTPDLPLLFFWSLSLLTFLRALSSPSVFNYSLLGTSLGLGFCSKYHIVLFVLFVLVYLISEKQLNKVLWSKIPYTFLFGLLFSAPVLLWNISHEFVSFKYQLSHGLRGDNWNWRWPSSYLIGEAILLFPTVIYFAIKTWPNKNVRVLHYVGWGPLLFFFLTSLSGDVELNWPIIAFPAIITLAIVGKISQLAQRLTYSFWLIIYGLMVGSLLFPQIKLPNDKLTEPSFFINHQDLTKKYKPFYTSTYQMASSFWYFTKQPTYKLYQSSRPDFFDSFTESRPSGDKFYLLKEPHQELPNWATSTGWQERIIEKFDSKYVLVEVTK